MGENDKKKNAAIVRGLKLIMLELDCAMSQLSQINVGAAKEHIGKATKRLESAISYFGGGQSGANRKKDDFLANTPLHNGKGCGILWATSAGSRQAKTASRPKENETRRKTEDEDVQSDRVDGDSGQEPWRAAYHKRGESRERPYD